MRNLIIEPIAVMSVLELKITMNFLFCIEIDF